jgi:hypothetical protein
LISTQSALENSRSSSSEYYCATHFPPSLEKKETIALLQPQVF